MNMLRKELALCLHPVAPLMALLSALVLVPNYPFGVSCFYLMLGIYFICLQSREDHDAAFTLGLPVSRRELVLGRIGLACLLQIIQVLLTAALIPLRRALGLGANAAGLDASLALPGMSLLLYGAFNATFFPMWFKDIRKVGVPFLAATALCFAMIAAEVVATYAVPWVRDRLDAPDPAFWTEKAAFLLSGIAAWAALTALGARVSIRRFERLDLDL